MKLFHREYGQGKPLIILHGLFGMSDNWIPIAKQLSEKFKVYLLDMRNHGQSPHSMVHDYESMSEDVIEFLNNRKINKAIFIGHSMGGKAVIKLAVDYPEKVEQMIILDISPKEYQFNEPAFEEGFNHKNLLEKMMGIEIKKMKNRKEISDYFKRYFLDDFILQLIQKNIKKNEQKQFDWKLNLEVLHSNIKAISNEINLENSEFFIKTLFVFGSNSPYFRNEDEIYINKNIPNANIKIIEGAGHFLHMNHIKELVKLIFGFLR